MSPRWMSDLGLRSVINAVGPATRLGGLPLHPAVIDAMRDATAISVRIDELETAVGDRLADLLGVPGVYVTSGAAAALTLATATAMTGGDARAIDLLPDTRTLRNEVVVQMAHRDPYDRSITSTGARLVEIGYPTSTHPDELDRVIGPATAAVLWRPGRPGDLLDLAGTAEIAHRHGVPVIVDGALFIPPVDRLVAYFDDGADFVAASGGKGFRGPQGSGLLCAAGQQIAAAALHHQDMDERPATWSPPGASWYERSSPPRHGIGRQMKVGREQVIGLLAAIERYMGDPGADDRPGIAELEVIEAQLAAAACCPVEPRFDEALSVPTLELHVGVTRVDDVSRQLAAGSPRAVLGEGEAWRGVLTINPMALLPGDGVALADRIVAVLTGTGRS